MKRYSKFFAVLSLIVMTFTLFSGFRYSDDLPMLHDDYPHLDHSQYNAGNGVQYFGYSKIGDAYDTDEVAAAYAEELMDLGFTLLDFEVAGTSGFYYLESPDRDVRDFNHHGNACDIGIDLHLREGRDSFISVFYSPDLCDAFGIKKTDNTPTPFSSSSSQSSSVSSWGSSTGSSICSRCSGLGFRTCSVCNGKGGYEEMNSVANFSGTGSRSYTTWHECPHCHGTGLMTCPNCGGTGCR